MIESDRVVKYSLNLNGQPLQTNILTNSFFETLFNTPKTPCLSFGRIEKFLLHTRVCVYVLCVCGISFFATACMWVFAKVCANLKPSFSLL